MARSAPSAASLSAIARPSPRPEPGTKAILPASGLSVISLHQSERTHVRGAASQHVPLVPDQLVAGDAALPRRPVILVVVEAVDPRGPQRRGEPAGVHRRIAAPPVLGEQPDVARFEGARLQRRGEVTPEDPDELGDRPGAVADRAADEPVALVGELHPIVLE